MHNEEGLEIKGKMDAFVMDETGPLNEYGFSELPLYSRIKFTKYEKIVLGGVYMTKINLSQKERMLLEDQKKHEEFCIQKYTNYANQAQDSELKQLFNTYAQEEQQHYDTLTQILSGQLPNMQQGQNSNKQQKQQAKSQASTGMTNQGDAALCTDALMTEKYISGTYNTTIFECMDAKLRDTLNHIQKEEQKHGEGLFNYMNSHGMYNVN